jgi:hypothetical protein
MFRTSLIALSTAAALGLGMAATASTAEAKTHLNIDVNLGLGGFGGGPWYSDCGYEWVPYKKWNPWHTAYTIKYHKVPVCY